MSIASQQMAVKRLRATFQPPPEEPKKKHCLVVVYPLWHWVAPLPLPIGAFPLLLPGTVAGRFRFPVLEFVVRMTSLQTGWRRQSDSVQEPRGCFFGGELKLEPFSSHFSCRGFVILAPGRRGAAERSIITASAGSRHERPAVKGPGTTIRRRFAQSRWRSREVSAVPSTSQPREGSEVDVDSLAVPPPLLC